MTNDTYVADEGLGCDLTQEHIDFMVGQRVREYGENTKDFEGDEQSSVVFFLRDDVNIPAPQADWTDYAMFVADPEQHLADLLSSDDEIVTRVPLW